jgi:Fe2+ transport system protein FeoA
LQPGVPARRWVQRGVLPALWLRGPGRSSEHRRPPGPQSGGRCPERDAALRGSVLMGEDEARPLSELRAGHEGRVACIRTDDGRRLEYLSSLGIVPGVVLRLLQRRLAAVVKVGETEVAIDFDIARQIYVQPDLSGRRGPRGLAVAKHRHGRFAWDLAKRMPFRARRRRRLRRRGGGESGSSD